IGYSLPVIAERELRDVIIDKSEQALIVLKFVFGSCALQALDLVDQHSVTCLTSPSGRKAFQVWGQGITCGGRNKAVHQGCGHCVLNFL
uniref:Zinc finger, SWIM-type containing 7 n=1 Tax=Oreochromis niloticus TaxID=8128 RepID=A0A669ELS2_ORENI